MVVPHKHPRIVVQYNADLPQDGHGSFAQEDTNLRGFGLKMVGTRRGTLCATVLKDRERHCMDCSNYDCSNRAPFDLPYVHFTMIFSMASLRRFQQAKPLEAGEITTEHSTFMYKD